MVIRGRAGLALGGLMLLTGSALTGCQSDAGVSKQEEAQFKNPPKEMPAEARKIMAEHAAHPPQADAPGK